MTETEYEDIALTCFRFLHFTSLEQVDRLSLREYNLLIKASELRDVDIEYRLHEQAFLNFVVQGRKKNGAPVYRRFRQFFNYGREIENALEKWKDKAKETKPKSRFSALSKHLKKKRGGG